MHELKTWQSVECPADLSWADGVTYFLGPLADRTVGPRVEWLRRAGVTPRHFATEIVPRIGLRPYFWARLRNDLEGHIHDDRAGSRLITEADLRHHLDRLVSEDPHLNMVIDDGAELDPDERRRRDIFSVEERRVLALFAVMPASRKTLPVAEALRVGGAAAVNELIDRAYLSYVHGRAQLCTAVPIYHTFLRARATDLLAVTPGAEPWPERKALPSTGSTAGTPSAGRSQTEAPATGLPGVPPGAEPEPESEPEPQPESQPVPGATAKTDPERSVEAPPAIRLDEEVRRARTAVVAELARQNTLSLGAAGSLILAAAPEIFATGWARTGSLAHFLTRHLQEFLRVSSTGDVYLARPGATVTAEEEPRSPAPLPSAPPKPDGRGGPTPADIETARAAVHGALTLRGPMPLPAVGCRHQRCGPGHRLVPVGGYGQTGEVPHPVPARLPPGPEPQGRHRSPTAHGRRCVRRPVRGRSGAGRRPRCPGAARAHAGLQGRFRHPQVGPDHSRLQVGGHGKAGALPQPVPAGVPPDDRPRR